MSHYQLGFPPFRNAAGFANLEGLVQVNTQ